MAFINRRRIVCVRIVRVKDPEGQLQKRAEVIAALRQYGSVFDGERNPITVWVRLPADGRLTLEGVERIAGVDHAAYATSQDEADYCWFET